VRIHLLGLVHTETTRAFEVCAFTARTRVFASMLTELGHEVILYAGEANEADVAEHVAIVTRAEQAEWYPWYSPAVPFNDFNASSEPWRQFNFRAAAAIRERYQPRDVVAITMGTTHRPIVEGLSGLDILPVEVGVGYPGVWAPYRVFESNAWRAFLAAREATDDFRAFDAVIPRAWEADDFPAGSGDGGYNLFMGRLTSRKGPHIAAEACKRLGLRLVIAGQGVAKVEPGCITTTEGLRLEGDVEYAGVVAPAERAALMGGATAVWTPTQYLEPGGGVAIEAQLVGTPVIASDYGCFTETVDDRGGRRCSTLSDYMRAVEIVGDLDRPTIRERAHARWATWAVSPRWTDYLARLETLYGEGWYETAA
jgi:glycosyltransferase involved in cell wall biosynthesis